MSGTRRRDAIGRPTVRAGALDREPRHSHPGNERGSDLAHVAVLTRREVAVVAGPPAANGAELS
jgi:hypothetical protein